MLAELSMFVRDSRGVVSLAPGSERFPDLYSRFLLVLPDLLGPYRDMNIIHVGVQSNIQDASWNKNRVARRECRPTAWLIIAGMERSVTLPFSS